MTSPAAGTGRDRPAIKWLGGVRAGGGRRYLCRRHVGCAAGKAPSGAGAVPVQRSVPAAARGSRRHFPIVKRAERRARAAVVCRGRGNLAAAERRNNRRRAGGRKQSYPARDSRRRRATALPAAGAGPFIAVHDAGARSPRRVMLAGHARGGPWGSAGMDGRSDHGLCRV